ncbi:ABC transporter ATP-binding protein [Treponema bryantii]|uniref:ABC transporter ATP-binding protein n=1 Tax=Treponema bryantii TaxID=163 RepID=UPI0003B41FCC|nr:ABC transporter ATP-binding protein [Treponema bryantii]
MIELKNITKEFSTPRGRLSVLKDFNLKIEAGTFLGLEGKSGAGKSTLLSIIAGLQKPDAGQVFLGQPQVNILTLNDKELSAFRNKNIGFISQEQSFLENLTVLDNVRLPAFLAKKSSTVILNLFQHPSKEIPKQVRNDFDVKITERALNLLESLGIAGLAKSFPRDLSGGENHRLLIARALMNNPDYILADEPTDSVDSEQTQAIIKIFRRLADEGKTILIASHDKEALKLCDISMTVPGSNR